MDDIQKLTADAIRLQQHSRHYYEAAAVLRKYDVRHQAVNNQRAGRFLSRAARNVLFELIDMKRDSDNG